MAKGPKYRVKFRRYRTGKTNYYLRKKLIQSNLPRIVIRKSNKHIIIQLVSSHLEGDKIHSITHSSELAKKFGWKASSNSVPAAYLTGYLAGLKINSNNGGVEKAILDLGLQKISYGSTLFASLKGLIDANVNIPHKPDLFPSEDRIRGEHIQHIANTLYESNIDLYKKQFSFYLKNNIDPKNYVKIFNETLKRIESSFK
ncbi:MAG: 50S ribosomal protein L18 [Candidatus Helarchaeota archaeon]